MIKAIKKTDELFPKLLQEIYDPPSIIYYAGDISILNQICLAIVGTRKCSWYGEEMTKKIITGLANQKITVISGLALGIDATAHRSALANKLNTAAIIGSGLDQDSFYPKINYRLFEEIIDNGGLVLSEYEPGTKPRKHHFPLRNRIVAGLSKLLIVVEAGFKSGALITAYSALNENREVGAVPGNALSGKSDGCHELIKKGSHIITHANDALDILGLSSQKEVTNNQPHLTNDEVEVYKTIKEQCPANINEIIKRCSLKTGNVLNIITKLELSGMIKKIGGANYIIKDY